MACRRAERGVRSCGGRPTCRRRGPSRGSCPGHGRHDRNGRAHAGRRRQRREPFRPSPQPSGRSLMHRHGSGPSHSGKVNPRGSPRCDLGRSTRCASTSARSPRCRPGWRRRERWGTGPSTALHRNRQRAHLRTRLGFRTPINGRPYGSRVVAPGFQVDPTGRRLRRAGTARGAIAGLRQDVLTGPRCP